MNLPEWMPPLPEPFGFLSPTGMHPDFRFTVGDMQVYSADQLRKAQLAAIEAYKASLKPWTLEGTSKELHDAAYRAGAEMMRERTAKACDAVADARPFTMAARDCASAIRALPLEKQP